MQHRLQIKRAALDAEARIIKAREARLKRRLAKARSRIAKRPEIAAGDLPWFQRMEAARADLHEHRITCVRPEARSAHLARCFIRGTAYVRIEKFAWEPPDWRNIEAIIKRFHHEDERKWQQTFAAWKDAATEHYNAGQWYREATKAERRRRLKSA